MPGRRPRNARRRWGRIVNIASIAGKEGNPNLAAYSASKGAVIALTKALGKELATAGILVNAIAPAVIETPMNATNTPEVLAYMLSRIPMGRIGQADEVAALVAWLVSDEVSFSTGAVYDISGGRATTNWKPGRRSISGYRRERPQRLLCSVLASVGSPRLPRYFKYATWRDARVAESDGLENRCGRHAHRGFKSHSLRLMR